MPQFTQFEIGITNVLDTGRGKSIQIAWNEAIPTIISTNTVYYIIYYATNRINVFSEGPKFIATDTNVTINGLTNSDIYYFAIRAFEIDDDDINIYELTQVNNNLYNYASTILSSDIDTGDLIIPVSSIANFPTSGIITVEREAIEYESVQATPFPALILGGLSGRGVKSTSVAGHDEGDTVAIYTGTKDTNSVIQRGVPTIQYPYNQNVDADGYAADGYGPRTKDDIVTTDYSFADAKVNFQPYDFCGYHRTNLEDYFQGTLCGSYAGGEHNHQRGLNLQERNFGRLEVMIKQTGEEVILLQRKWSGEKCPCMDSRREHQRSRCPICFNTGFRGGYDAYTNPRNPINGKIYIRFSPHEEDLLIQSEGLTQDTQPNAWALPFDSIKDRDIIIRFDQEGTELWRYEVLKSTRNKLFYNTMGKQDLVLRRESKTDIIYQFSII